MDSMSAAEGSERFGDSVRTAQLHSISVVIPGLVPGSQPTANA
jgi:hypothetical protein